MKIDMIVPLVCVLGIFIKEKNLAAFAKVDLLIEPGERFRLFRASSYFLSDFDFFLIKFHILCDVVFNRLFCP